MRRAREEDRGFLDALFFERKRAEFAPAGWPAPVLAAFLQSQAAVRAQALAGLESWVLEAEGAPAGQLLLAVAPGRLQVVEVVVASAARGRGLGTAALTQVLSRADAEQAEVRLTVEHGSPAARLYRRLGFVDEGPPDAVGQPMRRAR